MRRAGDHAFGRSAAQRERGFGAAARFAHRGKASLGSDQGVLRPNDHAPFIRLGRFLPEIAAGIAGWYLLSWPTPVRALVVILSIVAAGAVAAFTAKGRDAQEFARESMFELRKVVWPTTDETTRTTVVIMIVVVIVSFDPSRASIG
ncbi:MAG: preprotein translocase subunit SecE [Sphingopyxis sp.]|nr:preprotein translocase subunit SecE [Sphingopyxis sp.]